MNIYTGSLSMNTDESCEVTVTKLNKSTKENSGKHNPRFDFGTNIDQEDAQTATIKELLVELNHENTSSKNGKQLDIKSLETVLRFLRAISGKPLKSSIEKHSIADIKTIKTLFNYNFGSQAHLIGLIEPPSHESQTIIDILTSPPTPDNEKVIDIIKRIISNLAKEIAPEELSEIDMVCDRMHLREMYLQGTKKSIDDILLSHIHVDDPLIKKSDEYLAYKTQEFHYSIQSLKCEPRIHIATYTYLKLLDYVHWLHFEISTQLTIPNDQGVANKEINFDQICRKLSESRNITISKDTNFMSLDEIPEFIWNFSSDISQLVSSSTGFKYNKRDVINDTMRATIVLDFYLYETRIPNYVDKKIIGVVHIVSAFCSILHQRKIKSKTGRKSRKYSSKLSSPQRLLDKYLSRETKHVPMTVVHIYQQRTKWYLTALLGRKDKFDSHMAAHISQSELNMDIYMLLDHVQIKNQISKYRDFMVKAAHDFVALHNKQDTILELKYEY